MSSDDHDYLEMSTIGTKRIDSYIYDNAKRINAKEIPTHLDKSTGKTWRKDVPLGHPVLAMTISQIDPTDLENQNEYEEIPEVGYEPLRRPKDGNMDKAPTVTQPNPHLGCRKPALFWCILSLVILIVVVVLVATLVTGKYPFDQYPLVSYMPMSDSQ